MVMQGAVKRFECASKPQRSEKSRSKYHRRICSWRMKAILVLLSWDPSWRKHGDLSLENAEAKLSLHVQVKLPLGTEVEE